MTDERSELTTVSILRALNPPGDDQRNVDRQEQIRHRADVVRQAAHILDARNDPRANTWSHVADLMADAVTEDAFPGIYAEAREIR